MIKFLTLLLRFAGGLVSYLGDKQLIDAGEAKQAAGALKKAQTHVRRGKDAMDRVSADPAERERVRTRFTRDG